MKDIMLDIFEVVIFIIVWTCVEKFAQNILHIEHFSWIMFWGLVAGAFGFWLSKIARLRISQRITSKE